MKKVTSAAGLAMSLTWRAAALTLLLGAGLQTLGLRNALMPGGIPLQVNFSFSSILENTAWKPGLTIGAVLLWVLIFRAGATKGSKTVYTLNRLRLTELQMTLVFGLVFSGYFLLYWALQLGLCFAWFAWYSQFSLVSSNSLMMSVWDCHWFHFLLPLQEWFGYVRNLTICLSFGFSAAFSSLRMRRGKNPFFSILPCAVTTFLYPYSIANTTDFFLVPILLVVTLYHYMLIRGGLRDEDAL